MLLDSSFLIDLLRDANGSARKKADELDRSFTMKAISSVSIMELERGILRCVNNEQEKKKVSLLLESVLVLPFAKNEAEKAALIEADLLREGKIIDWEDVLIAGTALSHNTPLLTKNKKHFERVKGLKVESY